MARPQERGLACKGRSSTAAALPRRRPVPAIRDQRGAVLVWFAVSVPALIAVAAFVIDMGTAFVLKRHLQSSADAAALAGAQDLDVLPDGQVIDVARNYSAEPGEYNDRPGLASGTVQAFIEVPSVNGRKRVKVRQRATSRLFFGRILPGFDGFDVEATAVASKSSTVSGTPLAVFVHELCGEGANKGFIAGGDAMRIEGGIHVNGNLEIKNPGFVSEGKATVYRPPPQGTSTAGPTQGPGCKTLDQSDSRYCTGCATGPVDTPEHASFRDWVTPYHTKADVTSRAPCTHSPVGDVTLGGTLQASQEGVYCLEPGKKFTITQSTTGPDGGPARLTVIADLIEVGGTGKLRPFNDNVPVLFYNSSTGGEIILNPSLAYDWQGYIIHRRGGIKINAAGVTSPFNGLLEAKWVEVNGENFRMLGTFSDSPSGGTFGAPVLDE